MILFPNTWIFLCFCFVRLVCFGTDDRYLSVLSYCVFCADVLGENDGAGVFGGVYSFAGLSRIGHFLDFVRIIQVPFPVSFPSFCPSKSNTVQIIQLYTQPPFVIPLFNNLNKRCCFLGREWSGTR